MIEKNNADERTPAGKPTHFRYAIAGAVAGAAFGGMLAAALADWIGALEGAIIGGVLGATVGRFLPTTNDQQKVVFPTGREVDFYLNTTPLIQKYIQDKVDRGIKVEGHLHFLPNEKFEALCFNYLLAGFSRGAKLPQGKKPIKARGPAGRAREAAKKSRGFQSRSEIYINQEKAEAGTVIHESIHFFQDTNYLKILRANINEGTTEYFTRLICNEHQIMRSEKYPAQYECIKKLVAVCGEDKLAEAYFHGNISALEMAVNTSQGSAIFQRWINFMKQDKFGEANELL